jgi:hypothetical protein
MMKQNPDMTVKEAPEVNNKKEKPAEHDDIRSPTADRTKTPATGNIQPVTDQALSVASTGTRTGILGDLDVPEGVDPSFLAAVPEDLRQQVIQEQR